MRTLPASRLRLPRSPVLKTTVPAMVAPGVELGTQIAASNVIGCGIAYAIAYGVGSATMRFGAGENPSSWLAARRTLTNVKDANALRLRFYTSAVVVAALAAVAVGASPAQPCPSFWQQVVFIVWYSAMGLLDELYDTICELRPGWRPAGLVKLLCWSLLLVPIPYLMSSHIVYVVFALYFALTQALAAKLDLSVFKLAAAMFPIGVMSWLAFFRHQCSIEWSERGRPSAVVARTVFLRDARRKRRTGAIPQEARMAS